jgi:hypothetical protein
VIADSFTEEAFSDLDMEHYDPQVRCAGQGDNGIVYKVRIYVDRAKLSYIKK